ncbi:MAG: hypothetical protein ABI398_14865 [Devosia sp.]
MLVERLPFLSERLADFAVAPAAADRPAWSALPEWVRRPLVAAGETALAACNPPLLATDYLAYSRIGDRQIFEANYIISIAAVRSTL